jgi:hypothetical protein
MNAFLVFNSAVFFSVQASVYITGLKAVNLYSILMGRTPLTGTNANYFLDKCLVL